MKDQRLDLSSFRKGDELTIVLTAEGSNELDLPENHPQKGVFTKVEPGCMTGKDIFMVKLDSGQEVGIRGPGDSRIAKVAPF